MSDPRGHSQPITFLPSLFVVFLFLCGIVSATPSITLSKKSGPPTSMILVAGRGFKPHVGVDIFFDTKDKALVVTNGKGEFSDARIHAPRSARPGEHWVTALERNNDKGAQEPFLVQTNWSQFGFDVEGTRLNPYENVLNVKNVGNLGLKWTYTTKGSVSTLPVVQDGIVYVASDQLYALDARTGKNIWTYRTTLPNTPAVADGVVYVGSWEDEKLYALDAKTGSKLWDHSLSGNADCPPTVYDGVVYFGSDDTMYALRASNGHLLWSFATGYFVTSAPAVANGVVYVGSADDNLYALDAKTGNKLWSFMTGGEIFISAPAVANGVVYIGSTDSNVYALNASTGNLLWKYTTGDGFQASIAVTHGVVYAASADSYLYALDATTGEKLWRYAGGFYSDSPAAANGVIYIGSAYYGSVDAINASTGALLWSYTTGADFQYASPVVADGLVYSGSDDGTIYAFGLLGRAQHKQDVASNPNFNMLHPDFND
jgi:outer membrane protein assembly factor BamB